MNFCAIGEREDSVGSNRAIAAGHTPGRGRWPWRRCQRHCASPQASRRAWAIGRRPTIALRSAMALIQRRQLAASSEGRQSRARQMQASKSSCRQATALGSSRPRAATISSRSRRASADTPGPPPRPSPLFGQHSDEILADYGYTARGHRGAARARHHPLSKRAFGADRRPPGFAASL